MSCHFQFRSFCPTNTRSFLIKLFQRTPLAKSSESESFGSIWEVSLSMLVRQLGKPHRPLQGWKMNTLHGVIWFWETKGRVCIPQPWRVMMVIFTSDLACDWRITRFAIKLAGYLDNTRSIFEEIPSFGVGTIHFFWFEFVKPTRPATSLMVVQKSTQTPLNSCLKLMHEARRDKTIWLLALCWGNISLSE